jgi:hypothetical protein
LTRIGCTRQSNPFSFDTLPGLRKRAAIRLQLAERRSALLRLTLGLDAEPALRLVDLGEFQLVTMLLERALCRWRTVRQPTRKGVELVKALDDPLAQALQALAQRDRSCPC